MNKTKIQLIILNFLQFFVWGAWLISVGGYAGGKLGFSGADIGKIFQTLGIASIIMPGILGIIADKYLSAEKVFGLCHFAGAICLFACTQVTDKENFLTLMLCNSLFYMPTIALNFTVSYSILENKQFNIQKDFAPIRVWGTVGFIVAMWFVDIFNFNQSANQFYLASASSLLLCIYAFTLPKCNTVKRTNEKVNWQKRFGLDAFSLFKDGKMAIFFIFCVFLGAALQITNAFGGTFLDDFKNNINYTNSFIVKNPLITLSISQISETLFILTIPFFLRRFGIKRVMLMSFGAWVLRFALFGIGNPGSGAIFLIASMIIYGMAFDFFNISGSLFIERETPAKIRGSAQGLFMMMTNGLGSILGGWFAGAVVDRFTVNKITDWTSAWLVFAAYALITGVLFLLLFKYKSNTELD